MNEIKLFLENRRFLFRRANNGNEMQSDRKKPYKGGWNKEPQKGHQ